MQPLSAAHAYASDLPACADYFRHYLEVMDHARTLAADPGVGLRLLELDYEQTVADPDTQTRRILDFLGLDFDPACLRPHEGAAVAHTLSNNQVSRPIYRSAVHRHLRYASHVRPLLDALDGAAHPPIPSDQPSARLPSDPQTTGPARPAPAAKDPAP
jgi:hypothetical protein